LSATTGALCHCVACPSLVNSDASFPENSSHAPPHSARPAILPVRHAFENTERRETNRLRPRKPRRGGVERLSELTLIAVLRVGWNISE